LDRKLEQLESVIDYKFNNIDLLKTALTHSSFSNEHKYMNLSYNERLEFLGDAVLELISSDILYRKYRRLGYSRFSRNRRPVGKP